MNLVAIDPGVRRLAFASFDDQGLFEARLRDVPENGLFALPFFSVRVVIEMPRVYPVSRQKGDPNDLLQLARVVGRLQEHYLAQGKTVELVEPRTWKGTLAKGAMTERIKGRLHAHEMDCVALPAKHLAHNVWDAVGIGLHALGRLSPRKVVPR